MELTPEQIEKIERLNEKNLLKSALKKIADGKTLTRRELAAVRQSRAQDPSTSSASRFMEQAAENTRRFGRRGSNRSVSRDS
jgi:hypothetical protein